MEPKTDSLTSYVPNLVAQHLVAHQKPPLQPATQSLPSAILLADINGFTGLAERLATQGPQGAEMLSVILNDYFGQLIQLVHVHGGDVVKFAGDAMLAMWPAQPDSLADAVHAAASCALRIRSTLIGYSVPGGSLALRMALSAGTVRVLHVGGLLDRWDFFLTGEPVAQLILAQLQSQPGQIVLSPLAWQYLAVMPDVFVAESDPNSHRAPVEGNRGWPQLRHIEQPSSFHPSPAVVLDPLGQQAVRSYVPGAVRTRLSGSPDTYLSELRNLTVLFVHLPDLLTIDALAEAQQIMRALQQAIYRYEGSLNKLSIDDKGISLVVAFGLPPLAHEDDALRGVLAALEIHRRLHALGLQGSIGVTSGRVFCGLIGNSQRREYTMIGAAVNQSAHLMQIASRQGNLPTPVLCDEATAKAAADRVDFSTLAPISVKGLDEPMPLYSPLRQKRTRSQTTTPMVGRRVERDLLATKLAQFARGNGGIVVIEGEAGLGKSRLVEYTLAKAQDGSLDPLLATGLSVERLTAYHAWREVFYQLIGLDVLASPEIQRQQLHAWLLARHQIAKLAPLLSPLLPFTVPDNDLTAEMSGQVRADNTRELLIDLLAQEAAQHPLLILLEDAHWLDPLSWALAKAVAERVQPLLMIVVARPMGHQAPDDYVSLRALPGTVHIDLQPLADEDVIALVHQRLGVRSLPNSVERHIMVKTEGNPFFGEELAYALRDAGLIVIDGEVGRLASLVDLADMSFPDTIQGVITSRIDRLSPQQQLTLKAASVIGRVFALSVLQAIHPAGRGIHLEEDLEILEQLNLTLELNPEPDLTYLFRHIITHEVTYGLMLFAQRRELHRAIALWYEDSHSADLAPFYPILAHHWRLAEDNNHAVAYLEKAGEQALRNGAYREAIRYFSDLLELAPDRPMAEEDRLQQARRERLLADAHYGLGDTGRAAPHYRRCLALLGQPTYDGTLQFAGGLVRAVARQATIRLTRRWAKPQSQPEQLRLEAATAYSQLEHISYINAETLPLFAYALKALNNAELAGVASPQLVRAASQLSVIVSTVSLRRLSGLYERLALDTLEDVDSLTMRAWVGLASSAFRMSLARWEEVSQLLEESHEMYRRIGDWRMMGETATLMASTQLNAARYDVSTTWYKRLHQIARRSGDVQLLAWALEGRALNLMRQDQNEEALALLQQVKPLLPGQQHVQVTRTVYLGALAEVSLQQQDLETAVRLSHQVQQILSSTNRTTFALFNPSAALPCIYLAAWEAEGRGHNSPHQTPARQACGRLRRFAFSFPMARPRYLLWAGLYHWLDGHPARARRSWRQCLSEARAKRMPYEEGMALYQLGRFAQGSERAQLLDEAAQVLRNTGAIHAWRQAQRARD